MMTNQMSTLAYSEFIYFPTPRLEHNFRKKEAPLCVKCLCCCPYQTLCKWNKKKREIIKLLPIKEKKGNKLGGFSVKSTMGKLIQFQNLQRYCQENPELALTILCSPLHLLPLKKENREWNFIGETTVVHESKQYQRPSWWRALNYAKQEKMRWW